MVGGEAGVRRAAAILSNEIRHTFQLLGVTSPGQLSTEHVRLRAH
jgi:L-lactate dehydrogenase (cytochrome)